MACATLVIAANLWWFEAWTTSAGDLEPPLAVQDNLRRVPPADARLLQNVQSYAQWRNPYIVIGPAKIGIIAQGVRTTIPVEHLSSVLRSLPKSAWSYGRVVALSAGGVPMGAGDEQRLEMNRVQVEAILHALPGADRV